MDLLKSIIGNFYTSYCNNDFRCYNMNVRKILHQNLRHRSIKFFIDNQPVLKVLETHKCIFNIYILRLLETVNNLYLIWVSGHSLILENEVVTFLWEIVQWNNFRDQNFCIALVVDKQQINFWQHQELIEQLFWFDIWKLAFYRKNVFVFVRYYWFKKYLHIMGTFASSEC